MRFGDVYSQEFINKLNEFTGGHPITAEAEIPGNEVYVDIHQIAELMGVTISQLGDEDANLSGKLISKHEIGINHREAPVRQRFTVAHELGHILNGEHVANRQTDSSTYTITEKRNEVVANSFGAMLLMPQKLVRRYVKEYFDQHSNVEKNNLSPQEFENLIAEVAMQLNVSQQALKNRMSNLNMYRKVSE
ncbi:ImmA/IrrE family metallo-endopeptidase [Lactobacillaceae bacterium L1_55_11]|nr:ImmA/IrrE family metallo-endopeptidase [Lactobacillaceae bacterium L1_55_11]